MNHLKTNFLSKKDPQHVLILLNSDQHKILDSLLQIITRKLNTSKAVSIISHNMWQSLHHLPSIKTLSTSSYKEHQVSISTLMKDTNTLFQTSHQLKGKIINLVLGSEVWLNSLPDCSHIQSLRDSHFPEKSKYMFYVTFADQVEDKVKLFELKQKCSFVMNFSVKLSGDNLFEALSLESYGAWKKEILQMNTDSLGMLSFAKYVPENTIVKEKNPDDYMHTTFKLGLNNQDKKQKGKLVLPYKKIQIGEGKDETRHEESEESEDEIKLVDEEGDVDYDYELDD